VNEIFFHEMVSWTAARIICPAFEVKLAKLAIWQSMASKFDNL